MDFEWVINDSEVCRSEARIHENRGAHENGSRIGTDLFPRVKHMHPIARQTRRQHNIAAQHDSRDVVAAGAMTAAD